MMGARRGWMGDWACHLGISLARGLDGMGAFPLLVGHARGVHFLAAIDTVMGVGSPKQISCKLLLTFSEAPSQALLSDAKDD